MDEDISFSTSFSAVDVETVMMNMRLEDETQFYTLVKMHLSFLLHFTVDEVDAPAHSDDKNNESSRKIMPFSTKSKSKASKNGEGVILSHEGVCQAYQLIEFLSREENLTHEGLFRKTGNITRQQELKQCLLSGSSIDFESGVYSPHDCASVLKGFLANLSEPLLTKALYPAHCQVADLCPVNTPADQLCAAHNKQIKALQLLFLLVPAENYQLLKDLLFLLYKVSRRHSENKMNALNLGTMFAPHVLCPRKMPATELQTSSGSMAQAMALMIENTPLLFKVPHELEVDMRAFMARQEGTPGLNRRRRHSCSDASADSPQASTVFTFVDRQQSAAAGERDDTETALAGLYAHISSMPDSARRRKLIKQFNRESGAGTPDLSRRTRTRSFGESLRKHLFFSGKTRKATTASKSTLSRRSASEEALTSPTSPEVRQRFREAPDADDSVSMWPTPSLGGGGGGPTLKRALLTPTAAAAGRFTPRLARSLRQVQRESVPAAADRPAAGHQPPLPGSARRSARTAEMSTFRAGRNNSMRRGQVPLRPVRVPAVKPPAGPTSPISQKMDTMCSTTRVQMLTPRNRRAVCLLSQSSLPPAGQAAPPSPVQMAPMSPVQMAPLSPVKMAPLESSPSAPKRRRGPAAALSSPFQQYLLQRDMLTSDPVDLSLTEVTSPPQLTSPPLPRPPAVTVTAAPAVPSPARLLAGDSTLSDSLLECLDGGQPGGGAAPTLQHPPDPPSPPADTGTPLRDGTITESSAGSAAAEQTHDDTITTCQHSDDGVTARPSDDGVTISCQLSDDGVTAPCQLSDDGVTACGQLSDDGYRSLTSTSSGASLPRLSPGPGRQQERASLADLSNRSLETAERPAAGRQELKEHPAQTGLLAVPEFWTDAVGALPAEPSSDDGENQRRKTLTDRDTNPMAHRKIGASRKRRSVLFETDL